MSNNNDQAGFAALILIILTIVSLSIVGEYADKRLNKRLLRIEQQLSITNSPIRK